MKKNKLSADYSVHNRVSLIRGGEEYFTALKEIIRNAIRSIHLQTYIYEEDETGKEIALELVNAC
ncbi:MAG: phospholipase D-like domain-containing protein, partial [Chitinophagaceae bacterium]